MKCPNCGEEVKEQELICASCGASLTEHAEQENTEPENTEQEVTAPEAPEPAPVKKKGKAVAAAAVMVAVAGIGAFGVMKMTEKDPKEVVIDAFKSISSEDQVNPMEELFGYSQLVEYSSQNSVEAGLSLSLDSCSEESVNNYAGSGFRLDEKTDRENKKVSLDIGAVYNGMDLLNVNLYYGDEKLMAAVPELVDSVFVADLSDGLAERLKESPLFGPMLEEESVDIDGLMAYMKDSVESIQSENASDPYDLKGLYERYREGCKAQESFKAAMTVEKAEKGTFRMDGQEVTCKGYQVHISKDSMIEFLRTSSDFFLQDEQLKQAYLENLERSTKLIGFFGAGYQQISAEEMQEQAYESVSQQVTEVIDQLEKSLQDMDMMVYVDKKGRLAAVDGTTSLLREDDEPVSVSFKLNLQGGVNLTQNLEASFIAENTTSQAEGSVVKKGSYDGKQLTGSYQIAGALSNKTGDHAGEKTEFGMNLNGEYSAETGDYRLDADVSAGGVEQGRLLMSGIIDEVEKGRSYRCTMDELRLTVDPSEFDLVMSGEYYLSPLSSEVAEPEGEQMDVFAATEEEWQSVFMEVYFRAIGLLGRLGM